MSQLGWTEPSWGVGRPCFFGSSHRPPEHIENKLARKKWACVANFLTLQEMMSSLPNANISVKNLILCLYSHHWSGNLTSTTRSRICCINVFSKPFSADVEGIQEDVQLDVIEMQWDDDIWLYLHIIYLNTCDQTFSLMKLNKRTLGSSVVYFERLIPDLTVVIQLSLLQVYSTICFKPAH